MVIMYQPRPGEHGQQPFNGTALCFRPSVPLRHYQRNFDFKSALYTVTQDSNRMAAKLSGAPIEAKAGVDILSDGIVEGSVQVSANGQPIVMLADHQSTGGYAKIATVIPCDIPALAQVRPGQLVGFRVVSVEEGAEACRKEKEKWTYLKEAIDHD